MNQHMPHCLIYTWQDFSSLWLYETMRFQKSDDQTNMATFLWAALMAHHIRPWRERQPLGVSFIGEAQHGKKNDSVAEVFVRQTLSCSCFCDVCHVNPHTHIPWHHFIAEGECRPLLPQQTKLVLAAQCELWPTKSRSCTCNSCKRVHLVNYI